MPYIKRDLEGKILSLSQEYSAVLITGPRQVGKTTVLRQLMDEAREYVTLDDLEERTMARNDPALFLQMHRRPILIDEVQYAPQLLAHWFPGVPDDGVGPGVFSGQGRAAAYALPVSVTAGEMRKGPTRIGPFLSF